MRVRYLAALWIAALLLGCSSVTQGAANPSRSVPGMPSPEGSRVEVLIAAAADLQFALPELIREFELQTGHTATVTLGGTGSLAAQIENGAPADLFFAADRSFIERLDQKGFVFEGTRAVYAGGYLVIAPSPHAAFEPRSLSDLARPEVRTIAIANPDFAPYGRAAKQALESAGVWLQVQPKLVLAENIAQTFQFAQTGNADAAIVALSLALGVPGTRYTPIDERLHEPIVQEAAVVKNGKHPVQARQFLTFMSTPTARQIMKKYGFALPDEM